MLSWFYSLFEQLLPIQHRTVGTSCFSSLSPLSHPVTGHLICVLFSSILYPLMRTPLDFLAVKACCLLMFILVPTSTPSSSFAELFSSWMATSTFWCGLLLLSRCRTVHLSVLIFFFPHVQCARTVFWRSVIKKILHEVLYISSITFLGEKKSECWFTKMTNLHEEFDSADLADKTSFINNTSSFVPFAQKFCKLSIFKEFHFKSAWLVFRDLSCWENKAWKGS